MTNLPPSICNNALSVALYQPQIAQNVGNIARTCAVTGTRLILIRPLGFSLEDRLLKRAGLDYWHTLDVHIVTQWDTWFAQHVQQIVAYTSHATVHHWDSHPAPNGILLFGSESAGLPPALHQHPTLQRVRIPMLGGKRCLNLATSVGIGLYSSLHALSS